MTTQYTPTLKLALPVTGELSGTWGDVVNDNITSMIEQAIAGLATINTWTANAHTLTTANGTTSESRCAMLVAATGSGGTAITGAGEIVCPAAAKLYVLQNNTSYAVTLKTASGTGVAVAAGDTAFLFCDGTNVNSCVTTIVNGHITGNLTVDGNATINGNTTLGNATSDTVTVTARVASSVLPSADNTYDLGSTGNSWKDLYIDGTATMALVAISGGTINGVSIGATTPATFLAVDNLSLDGNTIASTNTNGNIVIAPNGTGDVQLDADTVRVGDSGAAVTVTSNGAGALTVTTGGAADLTLSTNSGATTGTITIANGANGNITLTPDGTGDVILSADRVQIGDANTDATLTTNGTGNLNLTTNNGTNSGTIQIAQGANGNITLTPNGTGSVSVPKLVWSNGTTTRVPYLTTGGQFTDSANLTFNGTDLTVSGAVNAGSINATTLDLTNLEVTNIKAKDGTAAMTIADSTGAVTVSSAFSTQGNTTLGNAAADNVTVTGTVTSNLIFTDNTYDIGASGATRPRNAYFSKIITAGQSGGADYQFLAVDYGAGSGGGVADGIYTSAIKGGTYQAFGFDTRYSNAGSWVASQTSASIIDGYQGNFRFFGRNDLTAGVAYTPALRFTVDPTGLASLWTAVAADPGITNSLTIGRSSYDATYGGYIGLRAISADQRQGLFMRSTGTLTGVAQYNIDFITGQTSVPLAANTGLGLRINSNQTVAIGGSTSTSYPLEIFGSGSSSTSKNMLNIYYSAAGAAEPTIQFQTANGGIGKLGFITTGASAGQFQLYTADGSAYVNRYTVSSDGTQYWYNVGSSSGSTRMTLNATGLGIGRTANSVLDAYYPATSISGVTSYGNGATVQVGTGTLSITGGTGNQRGVAMIINANQNGSFSVPIGANYDNIGLLAATYTTAGSYTNHAVLGFNLSDGPTRAFTAYTTSTGNSQTAIGYYVSNVVASGTSAAAYGVYIANSITAGAGTAYAIASDSTAKSYLAGNLSVGPVGSAWSGWNVADIGYGAVAWNGAGPGDLTLVNNAYYNGSNWVYKYTGGNATRFKVNEQGFTWWNSNGTGTAGGTISFAQAMNLTNSYSTPQLQVATTQAVSDAYNGSTYPGVVSATGIATTVPGGGTTSRVAKSFGVSVNTTYTVQIPPSDGTVSLTDIRVAIYCSSGSGIGNAMFCYGGHTGAYYISTVFNQYSGNVTIGAPTISSGYIRFTITIANSGFAGNAIIMVDDAGISNGKSSIILVS